MLTLVFNTIALAGFVLKQFQFRQVVAAVLVGFLVLTTHITPALSNPLSTKAVTDTAHKTDNVRPKTTDEWKREARATEGQPGKRAERIGKEAGQAFKEFGSGYAKAVKDSTSDLGKGAAKAGEKISEQVR